MLQDDRKCKIQDTRYIQDISMQIVLCIVCLTLPLSCLPPTTLTFRSLERARTGLSLCICITDIHPLSRELAAISHIFTGVLTESSLKVANWGKRVHLRPLSRLPGPTPPFAVSVDDVSAVDLKTWGPSCSADSEDSAGWSPWGAGKTEVLLILSTPHSDL